MIDLTTILASSNVAEHLTPGAQFEVAMTILRHFDADLGSRMDWMNAYEHWMDMVGQRQEMKNQPWIGAANVKYPLMTQAALSFNARALPALVPNSEPVGAGKVGVDPEGEKAAIARIVAQHMNYQVVDEIEEWEEEFDKLLMALPVTGMEFKKTIFDPTLGRIVSRHVSPLDLVINYYATDLASARKTEIMRLNKNQILERINAGYYLEVDWRKMEEPAAGKELDAQANDMERIGLDEPSVADESTPYTVLEYHGWLDLDGDGYEEPYIVTVIEQGATLLSIVPRFDENRVQTTEDGRVIRILPYESYTKFGFIPNPDGSFYDIGFGHILYPINAVVNTTINQLLDAGTLANMQAGFLGRGINIRGGNFAFGPGKWITVNASGDDLRKGIVPMPVKEPSQTLFSLMSYMIDAGNKLASTTDIFTGEHPGQNTKAGVTQAVRDEGSRVFNSIYKRLRRSLRSELDLIFGINSLVLNSGQAEFTAIGASAEAFGVDPQMYAAGSLIIQPSADPNIAIKEQKLQKDEKVLQTIMATGMGNSVEAIRRYFTDLEVERVDDILPPDTEPPQDPAAMAEAQQIQQEMGIKKVQVQEDIKKDRFEQEIKKAQLELDNRKQALAEWEAQAKAELEAKKAELGHLTATRNFTKDMAKDERDVQLKLREIESKINESRDTNQNSGNTQ